jgi:hypothetical protein
MPCDHSDIKKVSFISSREGMICFMYIVETNVLERRSGRHNQKILGSRREKGAHGGYVAPAQTSRTEVWNDSARESTAHG